MEELRMKHIMPVLLLLTWISAFHLRTVNAQAGTLLEYRIYEELPSDTIIGNVVDDAELGKKYSLSQIQELRFSFLDQPDSEKPVFSISQRNGVLRTIDAIDRDVLCPQQSQCHVFLDVAIGPAQYFQVINLRVSIQDINDNKPVFPQTSMALEISEAALPGTTYSVPAATDPDSEKYSIQYYELVADTDKFGLTESRGLDGSVDLQLVLRDVLDREQVGNYQVTILAHDGGTPPKLGSLLINISVADANDNDPVFTNASFEVAIPEDTPVNRTVSRVTAFDADRGVNSQIVYGFTRRTESTYGTLFGIRPKTGEIYLKKSVDYEKETIYHLGVTARDSGPDSQVARATVTLTVLDVNDNAPQITVNTLTNTGEAQIPEGSPISTFVAHISAADSDGGKNGELSCTLHSENFFLEHLYKTQYKVITATTLDRELKESYDITITCQDLGSPPKTTSEAIRIKVLDENDHTPVFAKQLYTFSLDENNIANAWIVQVNATDSDIGSNGQIVFSLEGEGAKFFKIHPSMGIIRALAPFDHEEIRQVKLQVKASDQGRPVRTSTAMVIVTINDKNDEAPYFIKPSYSLSVEENKPPRTRVGVVAAGDPDTAPYNQVEFSLGGYGNGVDKFTIDPYTGEIKTKQSLDREVEGSYILTVVASNPGYPGLSSSVSATIHVNDVNDNSPEIIFPDTHNDTVHVSNKARLNTVFARVLATDADIAQNAELVYNIAQETNNEQLFDIDPATGALTVNKDLSHLLDSRITLKLLVSDNGEKIRMTFANINIVVNKSLAGDLPEASKSAGFLTGANRTIVISLATASAVVVLALCVAIVIIKSYDRKDRTSEPLEHKTEAQSMLPPPGEKDSSEGGHSFHTISRDSTAEKSVHKKEVSFTEDSLYPLDHRGSPHKTANSTQGRDTSLHQVPNQGEDEVWIQQSPSRHPHASHHPGTTYSSTTLPHGAPDSMNRPWSISGVQPNGATNHHYRTMPSHVPPPPRPPRTSSLQRDMEVRDQVHNYLKSLRTDDASENGSCAGDQVSNTDSGRGASEEGEAPNNAHNRQIDVSCDGGPMLQAHGQCPSTSGTCQCSDINKKTRCPNNCMSCNQTGYVHIPTVQGIVAKRDRYHGNRDYAPHHTKDRPDPAARKYSGNLYPGAHGYVRDYVPGPPVPTRGPYSDNPLNVLDLGCLPRSYNNGAMSLTTFGHATDGSQGDLDDDGATTTSGSYTVDPDDLDTSLPVHSTDV